MVATRGHFVNATPPMLLGLAGVEGPLDKAGPFSPEAYTALTFAMATIALLGVCCNALVLTLFVKFKRLRTPANLLVANMSLSDLLVSLLGSGLSLGACVGHGWNWGPLACIWDGFANTLFGLVSIASLSALAWERNTRFTNSDDATFDLSWSFRAALGTWMYALVWASPPTVGWNRYSLEAHRLGCSVDWRSRRRADCAYTLLLFLCCLAMPVLLMTYCYGNIVLTVRRFRKLEVLEAPQVLKARCSERKVSAVCLLMMLLFLLCWSPYAVASLLVASGLEHLVPPPVSIVPSLLAKSNAVCNPLLFLLMSGNFCRCLRTMFFTLRWRSNLSRVGIVCPQSQRQPRQREVTRPKKKVTFSSSSIVFIISSSEEEDPAEPADAEGENSAAALAVPADTCVVHVKPT
ncbi:opsin-3-like [Lampetra fluviatilis]